MTIGILNETISNELMYVYYRDMKETFNIFPSVKKATVCQGACSATNLCNSTQAWLK